MKERNEKEMRGSKAPWPESASELLDYRDELVTGEHDYGTCVYATSLASVAAFRFVAGRLDITGFQAGCASMDVVKRLKSLDNQPFAIIKGESMLYPQYSIVKDVAEYLVEWQEWAGDEALKLLKKWLYHQNCDCNYAKDSKTGKCMKGSATLQAVGHWMMLAGMKYVNHWQRTLMCRHHERQDYPCICGKEFIANEST